MAYIVLTAMHTASPSNALGEQLNASADAFKRGTTTRHCAYCERCYFPERRWQKFCSVKCRNDHYWSSHKRVTVPTESQQPQQQTTIENQT